MHDLAYPSFRQALRYWLKLGCLSFGGPAGQIAMMHKELVEKRRWISEGHFLHALNFCMLLPGPEAQQLATYLGWRMHGWRGGVAAGGLFVLPSVFILFALSWLYMESGKLPWLAGIFYGLLPAVIAVVAEAVLRIGKKALRSPALWLVAAASFVGIFFLEISFLWIILLAAALGWLGHQQWPRQFPAGKPHANPKKPQMKEQDQDQGSHKAAMEQARCPFPESGGTPDVPMSGVTPDSNNGHLACFSTPYALQKSAIELTSLQLPPSPAASWGRTVFITSLCLCLWWLPILAVGVGMGWASTPFQQGLFFSQAALVTFGGAYAVLPYVAQQAVENYGWLSHPQMMSGLALAETTPGPLIMVLQFVGFVGGWQHPGPLSPLAAATVGALITTWATFLPCFLFVFLGAPHVEKLGDKPRLGAALTVITAAVVGVILNLAVKFAQGALWPKKVAEVSNHFDWFVAITAVAAFLAMQRWKIGLLPVLGACGVLGLLYSIYGLS